MWDYGPLGVELKNNVKRAWWRAMVQERDDIVGLDAGILMHPQSGSPPATSLRSAIPWSSAPPAIAATGSTSCRAPRVYRPATCATRASSNGSGRVCPNDGGPLSARPVQPHVQDAHGPRRGRGGHRLPAPRDRPRELRQLQERPAIDPQEAALRHRPSSASRSATRSVRATSSSGCASSSRWRCSTSSAPTPPLGTSRNGSRGAGPGTWRSAPRRRGCASASTPRTS